MSYTLQDMVDGANTVLAHDFNNITPPNECTELWCYMRHIIIELKERGLVQDKHKEMMIELKEQTNAK